MTLPIAKSSSLLLAAAILILAYLAHGHEDFGREASFTILAGALFGLILQRSRFCFFCILREAIEEREVRPLLGLIAALATGTLGAAVVFGAWIPDASAGHLPPSGNIGPVGWPLLLGGIAFGLGMAFSGSCISAHFYRLSEGSWLSPVALLGTAGGFALGFQIWNPLYLSGYRTSPVIWLPAHLGYAGALLLQLAVYALLAWWLWRFVQHPTRQSTAANPPAASLSSILWRQRWPIGIAALLIGTLSTYLLLRAEPMGVTSALGGLTRRALLHLHWLPERLEGLDEFRGCRTAQGDTLLTLNAQFVLALIAGAFVASLAGGHFEPERLPLRRYLSAFGGGLLLGFGAMISLGCTIGKLYSGITALSLCAWVYAAALLLGVWLGLKLRRLWW